ncbi:MULTISPECIES: flagellar basal body-associated protein FliL [Oceanibaculum]|uniref:Flagellar protein FliL n=1 Tax=Oceanibaculum indicum P24 TaxID=1207063 RepID=K2JQ18_9PROT|nr:MULTISPECIES: flagellar basal body-associated FliL family protein [Oceanibaculum]EKE77368.1 flagellar basal body-associated protein FliL [Oceanibaculum indicum P24]MCH2395345.1 flagellar basal body-associated FliL family protein [Oceanibaculum sp.]
MSDELGTEAGGAPEVKKLPVGKLILLILLPILLIVGAAAGLFLTGMIGGKKTAAPTATQEAPPPPKLSGGHYTSLSDFILTLRTENGEPRVVMVTISLQLSSQEQNAIVKAGDARLRDSINMLLSEQPLQNYSDPSQLNNLRSKLAEEIKRVLPNLNLLGVHLTRVRVQ